jgi:hypothetical protein
MYLYAKLNKWLVYMTQVFSMIFSFLSNHVFTLKFFQDVLKTFIGVFLAFWVSQWKAHSDSQVKEKFLLQEIQHELQVNIEDLKTNLSGHSSSLASAKYFKRYYQNDTTNLDSLYSHFHVLLFDLLSIQHTAAYETIKAQGLESILDDSLRLHIADLYDFDFEVVQKMEDQYKPVDFFDVYYHPMLSILSKCYDFSKPTGTNRHIMFVSKLPKQEQALLHAWLRRIMNDHYFMQLTYQATIKKAERVMAEIEVLIAK